MKLIQPGNSKLKGMYMWNMSSTKLQCGRECPGCYSRKEENRFPSVRKAREARYQASLSATFSENIIAELSALKTKPKYFRVHASSEFYSQTYIDSWLAIAQAFPTITFYAYTKRLKHFNFSQLSSLPNFILINSLQFGSLNYGPLSSAPANAFICPSHTGATCGQSCTYCMSKVAQTNSVYFVKH